MYKLLIITYFFNASANGGASVSTESVTMQTSQLCEVAKESVKGEGAFRMTGFGVGIGEYRVVAKCIQTGDNNGQ